MNFKRALLLFAVVDATGIQAQESFPAERKIEIVADQDDRFKLPGQTSQVLNVKANEPLLLVINAHPGQTRGSDGAVHSLVIRSERANGWDIRLKEGLQQVHLHAPTKPGEYRIECTVICGTGHPDMNLKLLVEP